MNIKWIFCSGLLAIIVFFSAVYFGIKYDWVNSSGPSSANGDIAQKHTSKTKFEIKQSRLTMTSEVKNVSRLVGNGVSPMLIDETDVVEETKVLGSTDLTIDDVVSQCQSLSESIGIPQQKLEQAISECVDRNSQHLMAEDKPSSLDSDRVALIREQCDIAITQKELLSNDEIKMLVDECVSAMSPK